MKKKPPAKPELTKVVAYLRVSTEQQASEGSSLEQQQARLEAYCAAFGLELVELQFDAGLSASSLDRPGLKAALGALEDGRAEGLLVMKLDRLTRSLKDLAFLVDTYFRDRFRLLSVSEHVDTGTAGGRMMLNVLTAISQWEREAAAERTAAVMAHLKASGKFTGGWPPFGFVLDEDGALVEDTVEQGIIAQARALKAQGESLRAIAKLIGVNPRTGNKFDHKQVERML